MDKNINGIDLNNAKLQQNLNPLQTVKLTNALNKVINSEGSRVNKSGFYKMPQNKNSFGTIKNMGDDDLVAQQNEITRIDPR